jgi:hypothetical protein
MCFQISWYANGKRSGYAWEFRAGGGSVAGTVHYGDKDDAKGAIAGHDAVYLYPDFSTLLVGTFSKGVLVKGQESRLSEVKFDENG